ncbi:MAG: hypothetical protein IKT44_02385, partial [Clostridia bacterium]|nr:hypothetical protein [Clostridia bacterium]
YGKGAGKEATASAVVADIMDCIKHLDSRKYLSWEDGDNDYVDLSYDPKTRLFVLIKSDNFQSLKSQFKEIFANNDSFVMNEEKGEIAFITQEDKLSKITEKLTLFKDSISVKTLKTML